MSVKFIDWMVRGTHSLDLTSHWIAAIRHGDVVGRRWPIGERRWYCRRVIGQCVYRAPVTCACPRDLVVVALCSFNKAIFAFARRASSLAVSNNSHCRGSSKVQVGPVVSGDSHQPLPLSSVLRSAFNINHIALGVDLGWGLRDHGRQAGKFSTHIVRRLKIYYPINSCCGGRKQVITRLGDKVWYTELADRFD